MNRTRKLIAAGASAVVVLAAGTGIAFAVAEDDDEALHGTALERATTAALAHTGRSLSGAAIASVRPFLIAWRVPSRRLSPS